jgi:hypothetical protein
MGEVGSVTGRSEYDLAAKVVCGGRFPHMLLAAIAGSKLQDSGCEIFRDEQIGVVGGDGESAGHRASGPVVFDFAGGGVDAE